MSMAFLSGLSSLCFPFSRYFLYLFRPSSAPGRVGHVAQECVARRAHEAAQNLCGRNAPARGAVSAAAHRRLASRSVRCRFRLHVDLMYLPAKYLFLLLAPCLFHLLAALFVAHLASHCIVTLFFLFRAEHSRSDSPRLPRSRFTFRRRLRERMSINHSAQSVPCSVVLVYIAVVKEAKVPMPIFLVSSL
jgi:hypothetical protein